MKETVKQGAALKGEVPEAADEFKGHRSRALHGAQIAIGGAEAAVTAERNEL